MVIDMMKDHAVTTVDEEYKTVNNNLMTEARFQREEEMKRILMTRTVQYLSCLIGSVQTTL
jgi:hypothetical protein